MIISFVVPGNPIPWARAGGNGKRRFNNPKVTAYKELIREHAERTRDVAVAKLGIGWPQDAIYAVSCCVRRKDWLRMDADRVLNNLADACQGILYEDDRHKFLRDAHVLVGDPIKDAPYLGVIVQVRDAKEHRDIVDAFERTMEIIGDGRA